MADESLTMKFFSAALCNMQRHIQIFLRTACKLNFILQPSLNRLLDRKLIHHTVLLLHLSSLETPFTLSLVAHRHRLPLPIPELDVHRTIAEIN
jgi:hypothetical protein